MQPHASTSRDRLRPRAVVLAAFALTSLLFGVHELWTRRLFDAALATMSTIVEDALPAISDLAEARREVTDLRIELHRARAAPDRERLAPGIAPRVESIAERFEHYHGLTEVAPGERELQATLGPQLAGLRDATLRALAEPDDAVARRLIDVEVTPVADALTRTIGRLIELNVKEAQRSGLETVRTHERARSTSLAFLGVVLAANLLLGVLSWRWLVRGERETERRFEELDAFAARVAHDLRGPLAPVLLAFGLARRDGSLGATAAKSIEKAEASVQRMTSLIDGLLAFARSGARPEPGASSRVEVVLNDVAVGLEGLASEERATVRVEAASGLRVAAAEAVVVSIVENLARNAILYLGESERREVTLRARREGRAAVVEVADTGPGIPADVLARLEQPFQRGSSRPGGHGLGLATVRRLAEAHGGAFRVSTGVGLGSTFAVTLPVAFDEEPLAC